MRTSRVFPVLCLVVSCALWGAVTVFNKALLSTVSPVPLLSIQLAVSVLALALFVVLQRRPLPGSRATVPLALLGALNPGISYTLMLLGLVTMSASTATLLWAAEPLMILTLAAVILREPVTLRLAVIILCGLTGVALITGAWQGAAMEQTQLAGTLLMVCAILCCALYTVLSRRLIQTADPVVTVAIQQAAGLLWCVLLMLAWPSFGTLAEIAALPGATILYAMLSGLLYYAIAYGLFLTALRVTPAGIASAYYNLIPVFGVALAYLLLGERLSAVQWAGGAVILSSAFVLVRMTPEAPPSQS